jgi:PAS domain S-box-containing protein
MSIRSTKNAKARQVADHIEQVRQARDYAEAILETISEPFLVLDDEARVLTANAGFYQSFRTSSAETVGKPIFELADGQWDVPRLRQLLTDLLPQNSRIENFAVEHTFPVIGHRHMLLNARKIHHATRDMGIVLIALRDVTAAVEATEEIEYREATRALLETASQGILAIDPGGTIRLANRMTETMFGHRRDELLGQPLAILLPERFHTRHDVHRGEFFSAPRTRPMGLGMDLVGRRKDGTELPVEVSLSYFETKASMLAVCFISDISERKQSEAAARRHQQELQALTARLISAQESSSKHLARELHDVFSQKLAVLGMEITTLQHRSPKSPAAFSKRLHHLAEQIGGLAKDIHQMSRQLHPSIIDDLGLAAALNNECLAFSEQHGIRVEFTPRNIRDPLPEDISLCLYRVAQESLRNIGKHSVASEVRVLLKGGSREIALVIEDIGGGFELEEVRGQGGLGLVSMDERVRLVGGAFSIQSEPGKGTRVEARVPLLQREA